MHYWCSGGTVAVRAKAAQGVLPCEGWEVTASQLDQPSLTQLTVAGSSRSQLGVAYWSIGLRVLHYFK